MYDLLDSKQLRTFVSLARTGSFTATAKEVFITQSAVSHSMRTLERELGCRLLNRVGKRTTLTLEGEQLLRYANRIIADMNTARESLDQLAKWGETRLRVGATLPACQYLLPSVLREFKKTHPKRRITLEPGDTPPSGAGRSPLTLALPPDSAATLPADSVDETDTPAAGGSATAHRPAKQFARAWTPDQFPARPRSKPAYKDASARG